MTLLKNKKNWQISENKVTNEQTFLDRRFLLKSISSLSLLPLTLSFPKTSFSNEAYNYSSKINKKYILKRSITDEKLATTYTNFYEFGSSKNIWRRATKLITNPWEIELDGLISNPMKINLEQLLKLIGGEEERIYRFRCVEAWSMTVPWLGFPLSRLLSLVEPKAEAKFLKFQTFFNPTVAPGQKQRWYPWPYQEGVTIDEAKNDLSFLATGIYGKKLPNQNGSPIRLVLPWKYGFKSIKSIVKISFVSERPIGLWEKLAPQEYGFWANVNPNVSHPRWSQSFEKILGSSETRKTIIYNGYEENVSHLYKNLDGNNLNLFR
tara:strand:- start:2139 stop:3104 length:966 start_codon:yes stop_codon:yes gene_type:complete